MSRLLFLSCVVLSCLGAGNASEVVECAAGPEGTCKGSEPLDNEVLLQAKARVDDDEASQMTEDEQADEAADETDESLGAAEASEKSGEQSPEQIENEDLEGSVLEVEDFEVDEAAEAAKEEVDEAVEAAKEEEAIRKMEMQAKGELPFEATENDDIDEGSALEVEDLDMDVAEAKGSPYSCVSETKQLRPEAGYSNSQNQFYGPSWSTAKRGKYKVTLQKVSGGEIGAWGTNNLWRMKVKKNGNWEWASGRSGSGTAYHTGSSSTQYYESGDPINGVQLSIPTWNTHAKFKLTVCYQAIIYYIQNHDSNKCLEARGNGQGQGVKMENCNSGNSLQNWGFTGSGAAYISSWNGMITMNNGQYCLDASERNKNNGRVHLWTCDTNNDNQQWKKGRFPCNYHCADTMIKATHGKCLRSKSNGGGKVTMWSCSLNKHQSQHWYVMKRR